MIVIYIQTILTNLSNIMKFPWSSSQKNENYKDKKKEIKRKQKLVNTNNSILTFDGKKYDFNSLSENTKKLVIGLQTADVQANIQQDTINILALGRKYIVEELKKKLNQIKPIPK